MRQLPLFPEPVIPNRMATGELGRLRAANDAEYRDLAVVRPKTRGDCEVVERPCPYTLCRHHLYLDITCHGLLLNFPKLEPGDMDPDRSCALDVAEEGPHTTRDIAKMMGMSRERARQIEVAALEKLRKHCEKAGIRPEDFASAAGMLEPAGDEEE